MMGGRAVPLIPTIIVAAAIMAMVALGLWQLDRLRQKEAAIARYASNLSLPATAYPVANAADGDYLFRTVSANCLRVVSWQTVAGKTAGGVMGWRHIARCATGAEGPGIIVDMGVSARPDAAVSWSGGLVRGVATTEPDNHSLFARMMGRAPALQIMIVSAQAAPGLVPSAPPDPRAVPNNHLAYAVQWFLFAGIAALIYVLALRARWRRKDGASQ